MNSLNKEQRQERINEIDHQITFAVGEQKRLTWKIADLLAQVQRHANTVHVLNVERVALVEEQKP